MSNRENLLSLREVKSNNQQKSPFFDNGGSLHGSFKNETKDEIKEEVDFDNLCMVVEKSEDGFQIKNVSKDKLDEDKQIVLLTWGEIFNGGEKSSDIDDIIDRAKEKAFENLENIHETTKDIKQDKETSPENNNSENKKMEIEDDEDVDINFDDPSEDDLTALFDDASEENEKSKDVENEEVVDKVLENEEVVDKDLENEEVVDIDEPSEDDLTALFDDASEENEKSKDVENEEVVDEDLESFISSEKKEVVALDDNKKDFPIFPSEYLLLARNKSDEVKEANKEDIIKATVINNNEVVNGFDVDGYDKQVEQMNENSQTNENSQNKSLSDIEIDEPVEEEDKNIEQNSFNMPH